MVFKELLKGETRTLVVHHELHGVTPEMIDWWWDNMDNDTYKLWHPKDHHTLAWQIPPSMTKDGHVGAIHMVCESIAEVPAGILRIRWEERSAAPITTIYSHVNVASILGPGPDDKPSGCGIHEYEATSYGTRMRSTFIFSADTPQQFLDALRKHDIEEMAQFPKFLPELYKQNVG